MVKLLDPLVQITEHGLFCAPGGFYVDPWRPVERALLTHAHSDHARWGSGSYLAAEGNQAILRHRLGVDVPIEIAPYGERRRIGDVTVSFHPAGHMLGSAQVRLEHRGEVWVMSGDYKLAPDPTCRPFEPVPCNTFITESTFGLPVFRWSDDGLLTRAIEEWWAKNAEHGTASVLFAYAAGKAQRILATLNARIGPIACHGAVAALNLAYSKEGVALPAWIGARELKPEDRGRALILAPPSAQGTPWLRRFGEVSFAFASGWMTIRGLRRRRLVDRGFAISDHADWDALNAVVQATGAERVWVTHGYSDSFAHWLRERGLDAQPVATEFVGEQDDEELPKESSENGIPSSDAPSESLR
jgi:putative mRNA 3-end processing factor